MLSKKTILENQYNCQRLSCNQTTQSRSNNAQILFSKGQDTHKRCNGKSTFCFVPALGSKEALMRLQSSTVCFYQTESFYRPLVHSNLSFIFTETFRWLIFYTVNYRRQSIKGELAISNVYHYQASWLFQELCLFSKPNRV